MSESIIDHDISALSFQLQKKHIQNHAVEFREIMRFSSKQNVMDELSEIKCQLKRPVVAIQRYAKTKHAAAYLDVDPSFLTKRIDKDFHNGIHYFRSQDAKLLRWDIEALGNWLKSNTTKEEINDILSRFDD